ncbi:TPA: hypothetical protein I0H29_RS11735 [Enterococcus faecalis]|nr:hypothetical protein [Enterococcus faecalis]HBI2046415.1 hypothetical protein [Enterococcus faecalis]
MKLKLINVETNPHEEETGSCELCMSIEMVNEPVFIFEKENGEIVRIEAFLWDWGHYDEELVENVVDFAAYISEQEFDEDQQLHYSWLSNLISEYKYGSGDDEEC